MPRRKRKSVNILLIATATIALVAGLFIGGLVTYSMVVGEVNQLQEDVSALRNEISQIHLENITYVVGDNTSLPALYEEAKDSIVVILGAEFGGQVQGSGFVYDFQGRTVIITNNHVVSGASDLTVTFQNGNTYTAEVLGTDPYSDLAVLSSSAPDSELKPIEIVSSSTLRVGDSVVAIGNPYGLTGSMTVGIVSQLGRTLDESSIGNYSIANIIQTSAAINPGNSGGPLLNYLGQVVGITTAIVSDSQGLGFAVPSDTILRELSSLVETGTYTQHSWLGVSGIDMSYEIAQAMDTDVTYGWLLQQVVPGGPADKAGLRGGATQIQTLIGTVVIGGDIIVEFDGSRVVNRDQLLSYLEAQTRPGQVVEITIIRNNETMIVPVELGTRPPLS